MTARTRPQSFDARDRADETLVPARAGGRATLDLNPPLEFFHVTTPQPCPYLPGRLERKVVTRLDGRDAVPRHDRLARAGFRRTRDLVYSPACPGCGACVPIRVLADEFRWTRSFLRVLARNRDLAALECEAAATEEQYRLFAAYLEARHAEGDMTQMVFADYRAMVEDSPIESRMFEYRAADGRLVAACLSDYLDRGLSAVYAFYDPGDAARSLGTYAILQQIRHARARGLRHVYLGYWIPGSAKMAYKERFRPFETLAGAGWQRHG